MISLRPLPLYLTLLLLAGPGLAQEGRDAPPVVKIPSASNARETQVVVNVRPDGAIVLNRKPLKPAELLSKLQALAKLYPDQAVILRGDQMTNYKSIVDVLDLCRQANIWNVAFATAK